ncbi:hypothetical protein [uncultured Cocleimonas sp.]|uniref:hypothetical protein n=1 Tax=uncultured Cocleimonas sp. TaxID=1051587 RepID=UPI002635EB69|nr:hypothetical protein [uncultured Cocleimonas sp.]
MASIQKLGILVVYFIDENEELILDLHLDMIKQNTHVNYTIYAAVNRLSPRLRLKLEQRSDLIICSIPTTDIRLSKEHAYYLETLADIAVSDNVSHLCTLDVDSFPIKPGWAEDLASSLTNESPVAAILREENGDSVLTHPSCTFFERSFWVTYKPQIYPSWKECKCFACLFFYIRNISELDTGIGISYILQQNGLSWRNLTRSNMINEHTVMGGVYSDIIFHLGAGSRSIKLCRKDVQNVHLSTIDKLKLKISRFIPYKPLQSFVSARTLEKRDKLLVPVIEANQLSYNKIRSALLTNPNNYISYLSGAIDE